MSEFIEIGSYFENHGIIDKPARRRKTRQRTYAYFVFRVVHNFDMSWPDIAVPNRLLALGAIPLIPLARDIAVSGNIWNF